MSSTRLSKKFLERRRAYAPEGDHNSNWAISYGDMITLLLAFFVLFFSTNRDRSEVTLLGNLVQREFASEVNRQPERVWGVKADPTLNVKTNVKGNRLIIEFPNISFFGTADFKLSREGKRALQKFAKVFTRFSGQMRLIVRGYTDNRPVKRTRGRTKFSDNLELSSLRAISALRVMEKAGIPFSLMRIGGYGETDKSQEELSSEQLALDRKIVLVVEPLDQTERNVNVKDWARTPAQENGTQKGEPR